MFYFFLGWFYIIEVIMRWHVYFEENSQKLYILFNWYGIRRFRCKQSHNQLHSDYKNTIKFWMKIFFLIPMKTLIFNPYNACRIHEFIFHLFNTFRIISKCNRQQFKSRYIAKQIRTTSGASSFTVHRWSCEELAWTIAVSFVRRRIQPRKLKIS